MQPLFLWCTACSLVTIMIMLFWFLNGTGQLNIKAAMQTLRTCVIITFLKLDEKKL